MLGQGTPQRVELRNVLLEEGINAPASFTFPSDVEEVADEEFRRQFPDLLRHVFLHDVGDPWLQPEWFDPSHPYSRYFCASPCEFYALASEILDPEGETGLRRWRRHEGSQGKSKKKS